MKTKKLLLELVEYVSLFESENPHLERYDVQNFVAFLQSRTAIDRHKHFAPRQIAGHRKPHGIHLHENPANVLSRLIGLIYRYAREYTKKALEGSALQTVEEFSFLVVLMTYDRLTKTELILKNAMVKTSGTEVVKRLLKKKLIRQFDDANDKRSQLVAITDQGLAEMKKVFPRMHLASEVITGNLDPAELDTLVFLLQKLEAHHNELFLGNKDADLEDLMK